jgi:hypothetical protein
MVSFTSWGLRVPSLFVVESRVGDSLSWESWRYKILVELVLPKNRANV